MGLRAGDSSNPCIYTCYAKFPSQSRRPPRAAGYSARVMTASSFPLSTAHDKEGICDTEQQLWTPVSATGTSTDTKKTCVYAMCMVGYATNSVVRASQSVDRPV